MPSNLLDTLPRGLDSRVHVSLLVSQVVVQSFVFFFESFQLKSLIFYLKRGFLTISRSLAIGEDVILASSSLFLATNS